MGNSAGSSNSPLGYLKRTASAAPLLADAEPLRNQACAADDFDVPGLPAGRVTLLFTDVEGSTRLLRELGDAFAGALAEHRRILRSAFVSHAGVEVDTQGDAFFIAFASAPNAAAAALDAQEALAEGPIRVRIGIHTGKPTRVAGGYVGLDVHLAARICAAGHGGQTVLSQSTRNDLNDGAPVFDLGEHRLKDFDEAVVLFQLGEGEFPPLKTISNTNLPRPASTFVGREVDVAEIVACIRGGARLVALTGPGGAGKTRLALEAAAELVPEFKAGVFWIALAPLREPELVLETVARVLGTQDDLVSHIGDRELLLLLDNFERLLPAATGVAKLVERCPNLHVLATSRERLRLRDEVEIHVSSLPTADAVRLFAERSGLAPDEPIARLCDALDGLPLAIELAAARTAVLSPTQILERIGRRLDLFRGARDLDPRQQTLRATIDWSYELLDGAERRLFACLAVFAGGCTLEAAEEIAGAELDTLQALVHKSLVSHAAERFWMLETVREYALERLAENPDAAALRDRHADWFLALAEQAASRLESADQALWLDRIEQEYTNIREALRGDARAARFIAGLRYFWVKRGYLAEGRRVVEELLPAVPDDDPAKPMALATASHLAVMQGDWPAAIAHGERCRELALEREDERAGVEVASVLGRALLAVGQEERAVALFEDAVARGAAYGGPAVVAIGLFNLGYLSLVHGDLPRAREQFERSVEAAIECGDGHAHARALAGLASLALEDGRDEEALALAARSLDVSGPALDRDTICWALELAGVACAAIAPKCAAQLLGAAEALREYLGEQLGGLEFKQHRRALALLPDREQAFATGRKLALEAAVELARAPERVSA
jgi:predicted ATPase/class 3 adenylate cyclase